MDRQTDRQVGDADTQTDREGGRSEVVPSPSVHRTYSKQPNRTPDIN